MNIEDLISTYLDGELSAEAEAEMHYRLSISPEDRKLFREHMSLRGAARDRELLAQPSNLMRAALFTRLAQEGMDRTAANQAGMMPEPSLPVERIPDAAPRSLPAARSSFLVRWGIPAACAVVAFVAGRFVWTGSDSAAPQLAPHVTSPAGTPAAPGSSVPGSTAPGSSIAHSTPGSSITADNPSSALSDPRRMSDAGSPAAPRGRSGSRMAPSPVEGAVLAARPLRRGEGADGEDENDGRRSTRLRRSSSRSGAVASDIGSNDGASREAVSVRIPVLPDATSATSLGSNGAAHPSQTLPSDPTSTEVSRSGAATESTLPSESAASLHAGSSRAAGTRIGVVADSLDAALRARAFAEAMAESNHALFTPLVSVNAGGFLGAGFTGIDVTTRLGVELAGGEHQLYAMFGSTGYTFTTVDVVGAVENTAKEDILVPEPRWGSGSRRDTWYGLGYRYSLPLMENVAVGGAIEGGLGSRYLRFGLSLPASYQIGEAFKLEMVPALQYVSSLGEAVTSSSTWVQVSPTHRDRHDLRESLDATSRLRVGLGLGLSFLFR